MSLNSCLLISFSVLFHAELWLRPVEIFRHARVINGYRYIFSSFSMPFSAIMTSMPLSLKVLSFTEHKLYLQSNKAGQLTSGDVVPSAYICQAIIISSMIIFISRKNHLDMRSDWGCLQPWEYSCNNSVAHVLECEMDNQRIQLLHSFLSRF